jgi:hypothetical protein
MAVQTEGSQVPLACLVDDKAVPDLREAACSALPGDDPRYFGLSPFPAPSAEGRLGFFVGIGRLPQASERVLHVGPRLFNGGATEFRIDYVKLYAACAADPEVSRHLDHCLTVYSDEAAIEAPDAIHWSPLIALAYLHALHALVQRHLRRGFITREDDLRGRIRGQVAFGCYAARGLARGHPEIIPCRFQTLEQDTLENRILRAALVCARRLLDGAVGEGLGGPEAIWRIWSRQADSALAGATLARITPRDFLAARKSGAYQHYAHPVALARAVLTCTGFDPTQPVPSAIGRLVPFRLATSELFERYVEVCLRELPDWEIWAGYHDQNLVEHGFKVRPDFLVSNGGQKAIVDAKYKDSSKQQPGRADEDNPLRWDVYQTLAYSRHKAVQAMFPHDENDLKPTIALCYPAPGSTAVEPEAAKMLQAALRGQSSTDGAFDLRVTLVCLPVPTIAHDQSGFESGGDRHSGPDHRLRSV